MKVKTTTWEWRKNRKKLHETASGLEERGVKSRKEPKTRGESKSKEEWKQRVSTIMRGSRNLGNAKTLELKR